MKSNIDQEWIKKLLATVFVALIFLLALTWIIFDFQKSSSSLKDSWVIVGSLFGGFATLTAAYVATKLVMNWKEQTKYNEQLALMASIVRETTSLQIELDEIRHNQSLGVYLCNSTQYLLNHNLTTEALNQHIMELKKQYPSPNFQHILGTRKRLLDLLLNLKLYANNDIALLSVISSLKIIEKSITVYSTQLKLVYCDTSIIGKRHCEQSINEWMKKVFNLSYHASVLLKQSIVSVKYDVKDFEVEDYLFDSDIESLHQNIVQYRKTLD